MLGQAIDAVERWYRNRGIAPCFHMADVMQPEELDGALAARGYVMHTPTTVMIADIDNAQDHQHVIEIETRPTQLALNAIFDPLWNAAIRRDRTALIARIRRPYAIAVATRGGEPVAGGLCVVDGNLAAIYSMRTHPSARRQGLARAVLGRLSCWAMGMGAQRFYLQVEENNPPARQLYQSSGFSAAYTYRYRQLGPGKA